MKIFVTPKQKSIYTYISTISLRNNIFSIEKKTKIIYIYIIIKYFRNHYDTRSEIEKKIYPRIKLLNFQLRDKVYISDEVGI